MDKIAGYIRWKASFLSMKYFILFIVPVLISGIISCASENLKRIVFIDELSNEEKQEMLTQLEKYTKELNHQLNSSEDRNVKDKWVPTDDRRMITVQRTSATYNQSVIQRVIDLIKKKYQVNELDSQTGDFIADINDVGAKLILHEAGCDSWGSHHNVVSNKKESAIDYIRREKYSPNFFRFINKNGEEKSVAIEEDVSIGGISDVITPTIQSDDKTIELDYYIEDSCHRENQPLFIKSKSGIQLLNLAARMFFRRKGKTLIPKGKSLVIICEPIGINLTKEEKNIRILNFISCPEIWNFPVK